MNKQHINISLLLLILFATSNISLSQMTQECDEDSPYPFIVAEENEVLQGERVCIDIRVSDFTSVSVLANFISFDSQIFEYTDAFILSSDLPGFDLSEISYIPEENPDFVRVVWASSTVTPETLVDSTALFELCYTAIGEPGSSSQFNITADFAIQDEDLSIPAVGVIPCTSDDSTAITIIPLTVAVDDIEDEDVFVISPNPVQRGEKIQLASSLIDMVDGFSLALFNLQGVLIHNTDVQSDLQWVVPDALDAGIYVLRVSDGARVYIQKLFVSSN